jgi:hypothetical protein
LCAALAGCSEPGIVTAEVQLQKSPATDSAVLARIPRGSAVAIGNCTDGWCRVTWNGRDGYVLAKHTLPGRLATRTADPGRPAADDDSPEDGNLPAPDAGEAAAPM